MHLPGCRTRRSRIVKTASKVRFSEFGDVLGQEENAHAGQERADDVGGAILAPVEALVAQQALIDPFDDRAHAAATGAVRAPDLADQGLDAVAQTQPAVGAAIIS